MRGLSTPGATIRHAGVKPAGGAQVMTGSVASSLPGQLRANVACLKRACRLLRGSCAFVSEPEASAPVWPHRTRRRLICGIVGWAYGAFL